MPSIKLWGSQFTGNCLPVSLQAIKRVRQLYPDARVVIGRQSQIDGKSNDEDPIVLFKNAKICERPSFHA